jgi:hypothetical protein
MTSTPLEQVKSNFQNGVGLDSEVASALPDHAFEEMLCQLGDSYVSQSE